MADNSGIEWTDATWGPVVGCTKVSAGCDNCYAETFVNRFAGRPAFPNRFDTVTLRPQFLELPLHWRKPRKVFVNSLADLFHADVPDEYIARVFAVMAMAHWHVFQVLSKRHARMRALLSSPDFACAVDEAAGNLGLDHDAPRIKLPLQNVWLGVSVEDQRWADIRIPALLDTPAAVRWISAEPLLGPIDLSPWLDPPLLCNCHYEDSLTGSRPRCALACRQLAGTTGTLAWVVAGGESGRGARPMHPGWARQLRDQCTAAGVPFLFKQWGAWAPSTGSRPGETVPDQVIWDHPVGTPWRRWAQMKHVGKKAAGRELDGRTWDQYPTAVPA